EVAARWRRACHLAVARPRPDPDERANSWETRRTIASTTLRPDRSLHSSRGTARAMFAPALHARYLSKQVGLVPAPAPCVLEENRSGPEHHARGRIEGRRVRPGEFPRLPYRGALRLWTLH